MKFKNILQEYLLEYRDKLYQFLKNDLPHVPDYIIKDFFYKGFKYGPDFTVPGTESNVYYNRYKSIVWTYEKDFPIYFEMFDQITKDRLKKRIQGDIGSHQAPNDEKRHEKQKEILLSKGLTEPIILFVSLDEPDKYSLGEGWHRVIQMFMMNPRGFSYPNVYIGRYPEQDTID